MPGHNGNAPRRTNLLPRDEQRARDDEIVRLTRAGLSAEQIAQRVGITERSVCRARARRGVHAGRYVPRFSPDELALAERLLDDGASFAEVARTLGRGVTAVHKNFPDRPGWNRQQGYEARRMFAALNAIPANICHLVRISVAS